VTFANKVKTGKTDSEPDIRFVGNPTGPEGAQNVTLTGNFSGRQIANPLQVRRAIAQPVCPNCVH